MARVIVAALRKWNVAIPNDPKELYELDLEEYANKGKFRIDSTPTLRWIYSYVYDCSFITKNAMF